MIVKGKSKQSESDFTAIDNMDSINTSSSTAQLAGMADSTTPPKKERSYMILIQIVVPFMVAGFGMVAAGILFDEVQVKVLFFRVSNNLMNHETFYWSVKLSTGSKLTQKISDS